MEKQGKSEAPDEESEPQTLSKYFKISQVHSSMFIPEAIGQ